MKKILKFSLVIAAVLTVMNVSASGNDFSLDVKKEQGKKVTFALYETNKVVLSIYDLDDKLIHQENVNSKGVLIERMIYMLCQKELISFLQSRMLR